MLACGVSTEPLFAQSGEEPDIAGALEHMRTIAFGRHISRPLAVMLLAEPGADGARMDPPGRHHRKAPANSMWNQGRRSVTLALQRAVDSAAVRPLAQSADVVVENFRPAPSKGDGCRLSILSAKCTAVWALPQASRPI